MSRVMYESFTQTALFLLVNKVPDVVQRHRLCKCPVIKKHFRMMFELQLIVGALSLASADVFTDPAIFERLCHFKNDGVVRLFYVGLINIFKN